MQFDERCYSTFEQLGPGMHQKNRNAPNSPYLSLRPSQTLLMISSFVLVSKVWDGRETDKSPIIQDYPSNWKPGQEMQKRFQMKPQDTQY